MQSTYQLARLPKKLGGVRYEPVPGQDYIPCTAIYIDQDYLRMLTGELSFPKTITLDIEVLEETS